MTHTYEEIVAMTAEELRWAIARAQGWQVVFYASHNFYVLHSPNATIFGCVWMTEVEAWAELSALGAPDWSNDIAAAWELVEEMTQKDYFFFLRNSALALYPNMEREWEARFGHADLVDYPDSHFVGYAETPEMAICRAYLKHKSGAE